MKAKPPRQQELLASLRSFFEKSALRAKAAFDDADNSGRDRYRRWMRILTGLQLQVGAI
jgi:hypothetical protein